MRKTEERMLKAIESGENWKGGNTTVVHDPVVGGSEVEVRLHGHLIAKRYFLGDNKRLIGDWEITLAGYDTVTTRSRLSALLRKVCKFGGPDGLGVSSRKGIIRIHDGLGSRIIDARGWYKVNV